MQRGGHQFLADAAFAVDENGCIGRRDPRHVPAQGPDLRRAAGQAVPAVVIDDERALLHVHENIQFVQLDCGLASQFAPCWVCSRLKAGPPNWRGRQQLIAQLRESFPHLPEQPDAESVFLKFRELRDAW
jgi:hypothetical protein